VSVIVTLRVSGDPAKFEEQVAAQSEAIDRIMAVAKRHGLIAHRWYGGEEGFMAVDEWPDAESFHAFFAEAQGDVGPLMQGAGVTAEPTVSVWRKLETNDEVGWGA
jgi:hypothetical protein